MQHTIKQPEMQIQPLPPNTGHAMNKIAYSSGRTV
jgi:hypothetical protein